MQKNRSFTATTTSLQIPLGEQRPKVFHVTNMDANPVTIKVNESGSAVFGQWVVLGFKYASWWFVNEDGFDYIAAISSGWDSNLSIYAE